MSTANMNINVPTVGVTAGPQYATDINNAFMTVDAHDHSSGNGVSITPAGLNISSDLSFLGNNATVLKSARFQVQSSLLSSPSDIGCLYVSGSDLYFNDIVGNQVRMTQSGNVAGSAGSISGLSSPASATYVSGSQTFVWQSDAATAANMDAGSLILRNITASSYGLTLNPPNAMGANYSLTLPSLPASQKIMTLDATGAMSAPYSVDNSTIEISSNVIQVKDEGITQAKLASSVYNAQNISNTTSSTTPVLIATSTFTASGNRLVNLVFNCIQSAVGSTYLAATNNTSSTVTATVEIYRNSTKIAVTKIGTTNDSTRAAVQVPPAVLNFVDKSPAAGSNVYDVYAFIDSGSATFVYSFDFIVYET